MCYKNPGTWCRRVYMYACAYTRARVRACVCMGTPRWVGCLVDAIGITPSWEIFVSTVDIARKILCTYQVMYSLHVRRMYRANLGVCRSTAAVGGVKGKEDKERSRDDTRIHRRARAEGKGADFYANICETLRHGKATYIRRMNTRRRRRRRRHQWGIPISRRRGSRVFLAWDSSPNSGSRYDDDVDEWSSFAVICIWIESAPVHLQLDRSIDRGGIARISHSWRNIVRKKMHEILQL